MPTYDYVCRSCGHQFELFQTISAPVKRKCPQCAARKLERLIGAGSGVLFKGSGFYQTDYRSDSYKKAAAAEKGGGSDGKSKKDGGEAKKGADNSATPKKTTTKKADTPTKSTASG